MIGDVTSVLNVPFDVPFKKRSPVLLAEARGIDWATAMERQSAASVGICGDVQLGQSAAKVN